MMCPPVPPPAMRTRRFDNQIPFKRGCLLSRNHLSQFQPCQATGMQSAQPHPEPAQTLGNSRSDRSEILSSKGSAEHVSSLLQLPNVSRMAYPSRWSTKQHQTSLSKQE